MGQDHACYTTDGEEEQEAKGPKHWSFELNRSAPHRGDPAEDLHACGHRNDHRRQHEVRLLCQRHTNRVHVVRPNDEAENTDGNHRVDHWQVAKDRLARECRYDVADDTKTRDNNNVDLWVSKEPQNVLVEDRVTTACWIEERCSKVSVGQQHRDRASQHWQRQ